MGNGKWEMGVDPMNGRFRFMEGKEKGKDGGAENIIIYLSTHSLTIMLSISRPDSLSSDSQSQLR